MLKDHFFRDSASCCSCCVRVVVATHDYSLVAAEGMMLMSEESRKVHFCKQIF